jgi:hypothetical protein
MDKEVIRIGSTVYLKVGDGEPAMVTGIILRPGCKMYYITWGTAVETVHYAMELTLEKPISFE